ncbi:hypothetical protein BOX15_Mlig015658g4 [Macrostomum lignano]|uniref:VWFA domain-containing protein n=1 Tax=Macrostomum lignano TaxID=282301 RepID=A0A267H3L5_9PLAT|nr:hypothetical protein BOX15_Mlig015658g4 [Macrostomum lignano]
MQRLLLVLIAIGLSTVDHLPMQPTMAYSITEVASIYSASGSDDRIKESTKDGTMYGDVYNWADMIQNYIQQVAADGIQRDQTQMLFDQAEYLYEKKNGTNVTMQVKQELSAYFRKKKATAHRIAEAAAEAYNRHYRQVRSGQRKIAASLSDLSVDIYRDSDIPHRLANSGMTLVPFFRQHITYNFSTIKIPDDVPRDLNETIFTVEWTYELERIFNETYQNDSSIRWLYFGSSTGVTRLYPGREWSSNFVGFYTDYDPRIRPWYIAATSGPKDVVIIIDCSASMEGEKFGIARSVAKAVIRTLTKQDYMNVVCARASHWDEVGKWHYFKSEVLSCQETKMVPATIEFRKDLMEKIDGLKPGGTSELEHGFQMGFELLNSQPRTGCLSILVFITDGKDTDGETVRCGPGYYTRSGYVPGPVCKYNWTKVWSVVNATNADSKPPARIFSYLIKDDGQMFPGALACNHSGSLRKLEDGENLISRMDNYFDFLARVAQNSKGLWTSPYIDAFGLGTMVTHAVPVISTIDTGKPRTIGVVGVDATLEEIETYVTRRQWGSVTSFLIDKEGQTIYHPLLKGSASLKDDPIFIHIQRMEQNKKSIPKEFNKVTQKMINGETGMIAIENGRRGISKGDYRAGVKYETMPLEYYFTNIEDSEYSVAFVLSKTDKVYRKLIEPKIEFEELVPRNRSYFNLLIEYNSSTVLKHYPDVFKYLNVKYNMSKKFQKLRITELHSSIFFAPKCYCEPLRYLFDDDLARKTLDAHEYMNTGKPDTGCHSPDSKATDQAIFEAGSRAYVLVTQPIEERWRERKFSWIDEVIWTYVGMRSGVFRTYPGHRSVRPYDPTKRPWYSRTKSSPTKTSISTPYYDSAGSGKIITISQAVFEGMDNKTDGCNVTGKTKKPGGCPCEEGDECTSGYCYISAAKATTKEIQQGKRCATERIEAITSLDLGYNNFHRKVYNLMQASDGVKSCNAEYKCPDGSPNCKTVCYVFDNRANVIMAADFIEATDLDEGRYKGVTLGQKEGEVMMNLVFRQKLFQRDESVDFQGTCSFTAGAPRVTMNGIPTTPEESDNLYKTRGPIPGFSNSYGCIQDVISFEVNETALGRSRMLVGNVSGPCMQGFYYVTSLKDTNLFLLVIENWRDRSKTPFNFNCLLTRKLVASGASRIINGTCAHDQSGEVSDTGGASGGSGGASSSSDNGQDADRNCPALNNVTIPCDFNRANVLQMEQVIKLLLGWIILVTVHLTL